MVEMGSDTEPSARIAGTEDIAEVLAAVEREYGVRVCNAKLFKGEYDSNIRFDDPERGTLLAKVSAADLDEEDIGWQETVLVAAAASRHVTFETPSIVLTREGRKHLRTDRFLVRVVTWFSGPLMNEGSPACASSSELLRSLGQASARLTLALSAVTMPRAIRQHEWMLHRGPEIVGESLDVLESRASHGPGARPQLDTVRAITERFRRTVLPELSGLPWAVVHHDLHDANVVLNEAGTSVTGVIDFNDAVFAPRISDLAISAGYAMLRQDDPEKAFRTVVDGYRSITEPRREELEWVGEMSLMRLCMNWAQWQSRALEAEDSDYALTRSKFTWPLIEYLTAAGAPTV